eukprot:gnl/Chilomastix_cuspidata/9476.p2 GENE.gnl/Chilomastix_cuspidata/9476~~gnl/Chilomastix_cuspidata/9476.p2  ORF type:complete len:212 (-),score=12.87 gnl/Chilomastix_cuspidata/9476:1286-1921(-)
MEIVYLDKIDSTHTYLKNMIKKNEYLSPICICADFQTNGIGSRGNSWQGKKGNLFFSFVLNKEQLPKDLALQSASIYFSFMLKEVFLSQGSKLWLKWPNDFYIEDKKIGGTITTVSNDYIFCGIGINLNTVNNEFGKLDIEVDKKYILKLYFESLKKNKSWKEIFNSFRVEFHKSKKYKATIENKKVSLENAILNIDGSINIDNKKVFSLR